MQLKGTRRGLLTAAALHLIGAPVQAAPEGESLENPWKFDMGTLVYAEGGGRVKAVEPKLRVDRDLGNDSGFGATATLDVVSGASPNGAAPAARPQTFSGSSGGSSGYTVPAYTLPTDPNFHDQREALEMDYHFAPWLHDHLQVSFDASTEHDYLSVGGGTQWAHDFNSGNTTLSLGLHYSIDTVSPIGGAPTPLSKMVTPGGGEGEGPGGGAAVRPHDDGGGTGSSPGPANMGKRVEDFSLGLTQILTPRSLVQFNYSLDRASGYLNDPYKILSVESVTADPQYYVYEARPGQRTKNAIYSQYRASVRQSDVWDLSYRFMTDDWGIRSHTVDLGYRWNFSATQYLEPHLRWYRQNRADFYHAALDVGQETQVSAASADPRLGAFSAYTGGLQYGGSHGDRHTWSIRVEYYDQRGHVTGLPPLAGSSLSQFDLAPSLRAGWMMLQYGF